MREGDLSRERMAWAAAVVALATSASWLAAISVTLAARQAGLEAPEAVAAGRALVRVAWLLVREAAPAAALVLLTLLALGLAVGIARSLRHGVPADRSARHV